MSKSQASIKAWALLVFLSLIWGSSFILIKKGLVHFSPGEVGALRIFIACLVLIPFGLKSINKVEKRKWPLLLCIGAIGSFIPALLFAIAQTKIQSAIAGVVNSFTPLFVILIGYLFYNQRITRSSTLGIILGFLGCVFVILGGAHFSISGVNFYAFFIMTACVLYAINLNIIKYKLPNIKALDITSISFLLVSPICGLYLFLGTDFISKISSNDEFILSLTYISILAVVGTALAMFIFNSLVKIASPVFASSCTYFIPLVSIVWGLLDNETINLYQYLGIGIILSGVYLANRKI